MNLTELGYVAGWRLARALPRPVVAAAFRAGADRAHRAGGKGVTRLRANLRRVVGPDLPEPELDALVKQGLRSYARYWMEAFRLPSRSRQQILDGFHLGGSEMLAADVAAGRGAVVALPHAGNWDAAGAWVAANGWPITTVAERLQSEGVYQRFLAFRRTLGMEILPTHGGDRPAFDVLVERLGAGAVVPLLADRDLSARGIEVDFFGGRTRMPAGPALLAIGTGAPLYVASLWYEPEMPRAQLEGPLPVPEPDSAPLDERVRVLTQRIADRLAAGIARHPQDWHMLQRMWLDQRGSTDGGSTAPPPPASAGSV
ncbi:lipid A biosynthesis lauroyl acyltransferase [Micromonospora humidisoli]|uniref:Phosphatidylinositol mannoside acyltransferase n=1 Tax=Micromonospora humidisoli TaxID=2807622 RepID=A0ABS2JI07_9ACTN|nr:MULTISPECIES: phosphatidylinositol mannoside acyltransferase [Micromonospora]MBM7086142.1 phosphatidylinositol mannoside acyltransferase [Micromonospora humidisoli]GHJ08979.1 lipid A biosynthesis lauroyl acyltransferase [Micromonospora sp. AKA109]